MSSASTWYSYHAGARRTSIARCVRGAGDRARAPHQLDLVLVLDEPHRVERRAHVDDFLGRATRRCARDCALRSSRSRDLAIPVAEQSERRVQRRAVGRQVRQSLAQRRDRMRFVEAEDLARGVGTIAEAVPDLAFLVASRGRTARAGRRRAPRRARAPLRARRIRTDNRSSCRADRRTANRGCARPRAPSARARARRRVRAHGLQQRVAPLAIDLVCVVHRGILHVDRAL